MQRENRLWLAFVVIGGALLAGRAMLTERGMGKVYVTPETLSLVQVEEVGDEGETTGKWMSEADATAAGHDVAAVPAERRRSWDLHGDATYVQHVNDPNAHPLSLPRSVGLWVAALFTIFVLSFLIKDNPLYKISESVFVGVSAAYWMVVGFWDTLVPNLIGKLLPGLVRAVAMPGLSPNETTELEYVIPLILGGLLLWRLSPVGAWISRWPMAFIIGVFCGLRLITFLHADFLSQIRNGIDPLWQVDPLDPAAGFDFWLSLEKLVLFVGVLCCLVYFFFSIEHKGMVGRTARVGIWVLMITFGAAFGYTVMGRIALLAIRLEFLFDDWLWFVDPGNDRVIDAVATLGALGTGPLMALM